MTSMTSLQFLVTLFTFLPLLVAAIAFFCSSKRKSRRQYAPQAGGSWPVIGHMHMFMGKELIHKKLGDMANKYGPVFTVNFGSVRNLVVSDPEVAKECFGDHDKVFLDRPILASTKILGYDGAMLGASPYGDYWREMRKIVMSELLSNHRLERFQHVWVRELETAVNGLYEEWIAKGCPKQGVQIDMRDWSGDLLLQITQKMVGVKICGREGSDAEREEADKFKTTVRRWFRLFGEFVLTDSIPALWWLDPRGLESSMKETARELDVMATEWVEEHKRRRASSGSKEEQDFMDVLLSITELGKISSNYDPDTIVKANCLNLLAAGTDTTKVSLVWTLSLLLNHPRALKKAQEELDLHVGKERRAVESDLGNLVYLHAVIKETMRLYPPGPLIGFRKSLADCTLSCGYHIPAGTHLMVNIWKIQRDERVWPNPNSFEPERFLTTHKAIDVRGHNLELAPFGSGRRACPGTSLALSQIHLILATLLQSFEFSTTSGQSIDMTETAGMTNSKATPLEAVLVPRLDRKLYGL